MSAPLEIETPQGLARAYLHPVDDPVAALVLGHGAGGSVEAPDLVTATRAAREAGVAVALVEQPYRVAGKRSTPAPPRLDEAWTTVVGRLAEDELSGLRLIAGGRSAGARVACRTAAELGAIGVLCLAFPLVPPSRKGPPKSRLPELEAVEVPVLIVQGRSDRFGMPEHAPGRDVVVVDGDHGLKADHERIAHAVRDWILSVASPARA